MSIMLTIQRICRLSWLSSGYVDYLDYPANICWLSWLSSGYVDCLDYPADMSIILTIQRICRSNVPKSTQDKTRIGRSAICTTTWERQLGRTKEHTVGWNSLKLTHSIHRHESLSHELLSEWASERAKRAVRRKQASERCKRMSKRVSECASG